MSIADVVFYHNDSMVGGVEDAEACLRDMDDTEADAILKELMFVLLDYDIDRLADIVISRRYGWMDRDTVAGRILKGIAEYVDDLDMVVYTDTFLCRKGAEA